jgi:hypothetical protein
MNYIKTKDLNTVILQNLSRHREHSPKAYISKPDVFCLELYTIRLLLLLEYQNSLRTVKQLSKYL